jgi:hypothetical protein
MGKITISDSKKEILLDLVSQAEDKFTQLVHKIEFDESVPDETWDSFDLEAAEVFSQFNRIREELLFS